MREFKKILPLVVIFILAFSTRAIYLNQIKEDIAFIYQVADSADYHAASINLANRTSGEYYLGIGRVLFYCYFLGLIYKLGNSSIYLAVLIQAVMGAFVCCLLYWLGKKIFDHKTGVLSGIIAALYWPFIAFNAKTLPVNLAIFFSLLTIISIYKFALRKRVFWLILSGISLSFSVLARPNIILFLPVMALWILFNPSQQIQQGRAGGQKSPGFNPSNDVFSAREGASDFSPGGSTFYKKDSLKKGLVYSFLFISSFILSTAIFTAADYRLRHEIIPLHKRFGVGIYLGSDINHVDIMPGYRWKKLRTHEVNEKNLITSKERDVFWLNKTKELIKKNPRQYINTLFKKIYILWGDYEFSPNESINYFREQSEFLSLLPIGFGFIGAFSIAGIVLAWRKFRKVALLIYLFIVAYQISMLLFLPLSRYRLPEVPFLILFASYAFFRFIDYLANKEWSKVLKCIVFIVPLFILINLDLFKSCLESFERIHYEKGGIYLRHLNKPIEALKELKVALKKHPLDADIYNSMKEAYILLKDSSNADMAHKKSLEIIKKYSGPWEKLNN